MAIVSVKTLYVMLAQFQERDIKVEILSQCGCLQDWGLRLEGKMMRGNRIKVLCRGKVIFPEPKVGPERNLREMLEEEELVEEKINACYLRLYQYTLLVIIVLNLYSKCT